MDVEVFLRREQDFNPAWTVLYYWAILWEQIRALTGNHAERLKVIRTVLENGLSIKHDRVYLNEIEISTVEIARAAGVDRRTVVATIKMVEGDPSLSGLFSKLQSAGVSLVGVARQLGLGILEIVAENPRSPGIIAGATRILAEAGISLRQALVDDPELVLEPRLVLITERPVPGEVVQRLLNTTGVVKVSVF